MFKNFPIFQGFGPLGTNPPSAFATTFEKTVSLIIGVVTVSAGLWFILQIFTASFQWLAAGSEKQALENAKKHFTNSLVGLALVVVSYGLIAIVGSVLGLPIIDLATTIVTKLDPTK